MLKMKANKYTTLFGSIIIMICIGGVYAWSIFVPSLKDQGLSTAQTQMIFGFMIAFFTVSMIFAGKIEKRFGPRVTCFVGAIMFAAGYLLAWNWEGNFLVLLSGLSLFSGSGIGLCYLSCLITPVKWFPRKKGLITGISVAGFGFGAIVLSGFVDHLLAKEIIITEIFLIIAVTYGAALMLGAILLKPKDPDKKDKTAYKEINLLRSRNFWGLSMGIFAGTFTGLLLIGNLKPIGLWSNIDETWATFSISVLAIGNMAGRVFWGHLSDSLQGKKIINLALSFLAVSCLALIFTRVNPALFLINTFAIGLGFGANFVLFAKEVSNIYGIEKLGLIYPYVFLFYGLAGIIGPSIGGAIYDISSSYYIPIFVAGGVCIIGILVHSVLIKEKFLKSGAL